LLTGTGSFIAPSETPAEFVPNRVPYKTTGRLVTSVSHVGSNPATADDTGRRKLIFLVTEDWYFVSHRLELAVAARNAGYDVVVATRVDRHGKTITDAGFTLCPVAFNRSGLNPLEDFRTLMQLVRLFRREAPDIVHHVALKPVIYGSLAARIAGVKGVVNALGGLGYVFSSVSLRAKMLRWITKPALKLALGGRNSRLIVQNRDDRDIIVADGLADAGSVILIRGAGVDPSAYRQVTVASEMPLIILPARLLREKGVGEFVEAARLLRGQGVKARFALVGKPDLANPTSVSQHEIDTWVSEDVVEYWGWQDDMPDIFSQAQIVCLPTYYGEGLPKSLLEAAASGCAIVTTDIPGCREIVQQGVTGWLVPTRDVRALAIALQQAIEQPGLREQFGASARALIATDFSMNRVASETIAIYDELMM
jgi:glycosyltransferase involved in cell wall biosynthesis